MTCSALLRLACAVGGLICTAGFNASHARGAEAAPNPEESEFREIQDLRPHKGLVVSDVPLSKEHEVWNQGVAQEALAIADRARKFNADFPNSSHRKQVEGIEREALLLASKAGDGSARARLEALLEKALKQPNLDEDGRMALRWQAVQNTIAAKANQGTRALAPDMEKASRELIKEFPRRSEPYLALLRLADERKDTNMVQEVLACTQAPEAARQQAASILHRFDLRSQPPQIHFTALDGQDVDLLKLRGKVTLVDFWATWCGPCVAEFPNITAAYEKFHGRGFEVIGISLDRDQSALLKFVKARKIPWPQYFDGKGMQNKYAQDYGITSIPAMWLINQEGKVVDWDARQDLTGKLEKLLGVTPGGTANGTQSIRSK